MFQVDDLDTVNVNIGPVCMYVWQEGCASVAHTLDKIDLFVEMDDSVVDSDDV